MRGDGWVLSFQQGLWGGQATIMVCDCDGGWNGDDGSLNSLTAIGPYLAHRLFWALFKVNNFSNFCPLTTFDSSKCSWALQLEYWCFTFLGSLLHWWHEWRVCFGSRNCLAFLRQSTVRKLPYLMGHKHQLNYKVQRSKSSLFSCQVKSQECTGSA